MLTFWRHGYETTSIVDLTTAMGVTAPSLYTAFGDKKRLFLEALGLYTGDVEAIGARISSAPTSYDAASGMLTTAAEAFTGTTTPKGCLLASAAATGSAASADIQQTVAAIRSAIAAHLRARIELDVETDVLPKATDADALTGLVMAVIQGMSVLARDGMARTPLLAIAATAMAAWPVRDRVR